MSNRINTILFLSEEGNCLCDACIAHMPHCINGKPQDICTDEEGYNTVTGCYQYVPRPDSILGIEEEQVKPICIDCTKRKMCPHVWKRKFCLTYEKENRT